MRGLAGYVLAIVLATDDDLGLRVSLISLCQIFLNVD